MNANLDTLQPLPASLGTAASQQRRRDIGGFIPDPARVAAFNRVLRELDPARAPVGIDQIASAARDLAQSPSGAEDPSTPTCIDQRLRRMADIDRMVSDLGWEAANDAAAPARAIAGYFHDPRKAIPQALPRVGQLDVALLVDAAWPRLAAEIADYHDYRRLRSIERELRGVNAGDFRFDRQDWREARAAESALVEHMHRVGTSSYVPAGGWRRFMVC